VRGQPRSASTGDMAGKLAVGGAVRLLVSACKSPRMSNLGTRAISGVQEATWTS
jgi:hypothetical protein